MVRGFSSEEQGKFRIGEGGVDLIPSFKKAIQSSYNPVYFPDFLGEP